MCWTVRARKQEADWGKYLISLVAAQTDAHWMAVPDTVEPMVALPAQAANYWLGMKDNHKLVVVKSVVGSRNLEQIAQGCTRSRDSFFRHWSAMRMEGSHSGLEQNNHSHNLHSSGVLVGW